MNGAWHAVGGLRRCSDHPYQPVRGTFGRKGNAAHDLADAARSLEFLRDNQHHRQRSGSNNPCPSRRHSIGAPDDIVLHGGTLLQLPQAGRLIISTFLRIWAV